MFIKRLMKLLIDHRYYIFALSFRGCITLETKTRIKLPIFRQFWACVVALQRWRLPLGFARRVLLERFHDTFKLICRPYIGYSSWIDLGLTGLKMNWLYWKSHWIIQKRREQQLGVDGWEGRERHRKTRPKGNWRGAGRTGEGAEGTGTHLQIEVAAAVGS